MKRYNYSQVELYEIKSPIQDCSNIPIGINDSTIEERKNKILSLMNENLIDSLVIYGDLEHGSNFEYLVGFLPRFEEGLLILHKDGRAYLILGNENLNKGKFSRIPVKAIHSPIFSLPNQPMFDDKEMRNLYFEAGIEENSHIGVVGWKVFTSKTMDNKDIFDVPHYLIEPLKKISETVINCTDFFIGGKYGARTINNANECAHYELGASLASDCMLKAMNILDIGVSEMVIGDNLNAFGQKNTVVTIASAGDRFYKGNLYPTDKQVKLGDAISLTVGYKGGLSSRSGYAVSETAQLPNNLQDYLEKLVNPYYTSIVAWLENVSCGIKGNEIYDLINEVLPKDQYNWSLCPGHLTGDEEWMSSPIYENSCEVLKSGMIFQTDIIPSVVGYGGISVEGTVLLADQRLRDEIKYIYPEMWHRMEKRREFIIKKLHIQLSEDLLPMSSTVAYLRPYLLNREYAMRKKL